MLKVMNDHFQAGHGFLFGSRPSAADFALYGQVRTTVALPALFAPLD